MRARRDQHASAGHRGRTSVHWRGAAFVVAAAALSLTAGAVPASAAGGYTVTATIAVGTFPSGVAVDSAAGTVYVVNSGGGTVSVIDEATGTVTATIPVGIAPTGVAVDPTAGTVYVVNHAAGTVSVIDEATNAVTGTIAVGVEPADVAVDTTTGTVYVTNSNDGTVSVIDEATGTVTATVPVGMDPSDVAFDPATHTAYVTNFSDGTVSVITAAPALPTPVVRVTSSQHPSTFGQKVTLTATVYPVDGGTITFSNGTTALCTAVALTQVTAYKYQATCTTTALPAGEQVTVTAVYPGDASYATATGTLTQTVKRAPTTLTARIHVGKHGLYDLIATLTGAGQRVSGEPVSFSTGSTHLCTPVTNARGRASCALTSAQTSLVQKDNDTVRATFAGDTNYKTSTTTASAS